MTKKIELNEYRKAVLVAYQNLPANPHNHQVDEFAFCLLGVSELDEKPYNHFSSYYAYRCAWTRTELTNDGYLTEGSKGVRNLTQQGKETFVGPINA
jgi:hypothetical protein